MFSKSKKELYLYEPFYMENKKQPPGHEIAVAAKAGNAPVVLVVSR